MAVPACQLSVRSPARQQGLALITAVLVVAMAAVAATAMVVSQQYSVRRTANMLHGEQAEFFAVAAESWARVLLRRDGRDNQVDTLEETWAQPLAPVLIEGGSLQGYIEDEQGRLNLNNLLGPGGVSADAVTQFQRLLQVLELDEELVNALLDWLDADVDVRFPRGAEDDTYLGKEPPYRTANRRMADISELRLVEGFSAEVIEKLAPYVAALPEVTELNVNTAPAAVLATLAEGVSLREAESLVEERAEEPFEDLEVFKAHTAFAGRELLGVGLALRTHYFRLHGMVQVGRGQIWLSSLLHRADDQQVSLVARSRVLPQPAV